MFWQSEVKCDGHDLWRLHVPRLLRTPGDYGSPHKTYDEEGGQKDPVPVENWKGITWLTKHPHITANSNNYHTNIRNNRVRTTSMIVRRRQNSTGCDLLTPKRLKHMIRCHIYGELHSRKSWSTCRPTWSTLSLSKRRTFPLALHEIAFPRSCTQHTLCTVPSKVS